MNLNKNIIWMLQPPRSGGTLFCRLLDGHSKILVFPTVFRFSRRIWPKSFLKKNIHSLVKLFKFMITDKFNKTGIKKKSSNIKQKTYPFVFDKTKIINGLKKNYNIINNTNYLIFFFNSFFESWKNLKHRNKNVKFFFGHSTLINPNSFTLNVENFFNNNNCHSIVYIVRNPVSWYLSSKYLRFAIDQFKNKKDIDKYFNYYSSMLNQAIKLKKKHNIIFIDFEDLIRNSKKTLKTFSREVNIRYEDTLIVPSFNGEDWIANSSFNIKSKKIDVNVLKKKRKLTLNEKKSMQKYNCVEFYEKAKKKCI